jgi:integrase/recombinase XerD
MGLRASPRAAAAAASTAERLLWHSGVPPEDLRAEHARAYLVSIRERGRAVKTLWNARSYLLAFGAFLNERGIPVPDLAASIRLPRPERPPPRYLDDEELRAVLAAARESGVWPAVSLAIWTGLRLGELRRLAWADVDADRRTLLVRRGKGGRFRVVPLNVRAMEALAEQRRITGRLAHVFPTRRTWRGGWRWRDGPRAESSWRRDLEAVCRSVPKFRQAVGTGRGWHLLRHTFASRAAQAGVSLYKLADWLGHTDVRTTAIYAHLAAGYDRDVERVCTEEADR